MSNVKQLLLASVQTAAEIVRDSGLTAGAEAQPSTGAVQQQGSAAPKKNGR